MRLLLLEDDDRVARGILRLAMSLGHEGLHVHSLAEAKESFLAHPADLVLADVGLRDGENGADFLDWLRETSPDTLRVLMSGAVVPAGYQAVPPRELYLAKPFGRAEMIQLFVEAAKQSS